MGRSMHIHIYIYCHAYIIHLSTFSETLPCCRCMACATSFTMGHGENA